MRPYDASSVISARPGRQVLCDGRHWPKWDSGVDAVEGSITPGETIVIRSQAVEAGG